MLKKLSLGAAIATTLAVSAPATASDWLWDTNANKIDDRIESVEADGLKAAFENADPTDGRLRFAVFDTTPLSYGVYVGFDHHPTDEDIEAIGALGVSTAVMKRYTTIDYVRMQLTAAEIGAVASLDGVSRIEAVPMMYAFNNNANRASGVTESSFQRFPTVHEHLGITGRDVVVGILDTGVNDEPDMLTGFPGHESVQGKFIAGGNFFAGQPALNTPPEDSENPVDRGEAAASNHGTHVAGTAIGTGGDSGVFGGVAPGALLVDGKVLSDAGAGFGSADGVEWAVLNKELYDIRVLNLSLGGVDESDGTDASSQAINAAFDAGLISVIASGNDGNTDYMPSPAAADRAITVGAIADKNSVTREDDAMADYSNEGPRDDDGDATHEDEMKPEVAAPGSGIVSADGSLLSDGRQYKALSGTSMATPHVAGVIALMLEANPALSPAQVDEILRHTAEHRFDWGKTAIDDRPYSEIDPNYHPSGGWGQVDAYAAVKEALRLAGDPNSQTQVVRITAEAAADGSNAVELGWLTQREINLQGFDVYRAPDVGGAPGTFERVTASTIAGVGSPTIERTSNRNEYSFRDDGLAFGTSYWYRIEHSSSDPAVGVVTEPAIQVTLGEAPAVALLQYSITHNAFDNDLLVLLGSGPETERARFVIDGASPEDADSVSTEAGESTTGTTRYEFTVPLTAVHDVGDLLPPSKENPWWLTVKEGGYINRTGRVNSFSITLLDADGNPVETYTSGDLAPQQTVETQTTTLWIPDDPNVFVPGDQPTVIEADPASAAAGQTVAVEVFGAEFVPGASLSVSGEGITVSDVEVRSGARLTATLTIAADAAAGARDLTVANIDGGSDTAQGAFSVIGDGNGGGDPVVSDIDDADAAIDYERGWHRVESAEASNGGYHVRMGGNGNGPSPRAAVAFEGEQITYRYATSRLGGTADVFIDGELVAADVSFAGDAPQDAPDFGHSITFDGLDQGSHQLVIEHRSGAVYLDGFQIVSDGDGGPDASSVDSRSQTTTHEHSPGPLSLMVTETVDIGPDDQHLAVMVEGLGISAPVELLGPSGNLLASGEALLEGTTLSGLDAVPTAQGTYTIRVLNPTLTGDALTLRVTRTVAVH